MRHPVPTDPIKMKWRAFRRAGAWMVIFGLTILFVANVVQSTILSYVGAIMPILGMCVTVFGTVMGPPREKK